MAKPSWSQPVWVNTHPNLTSRVWAGWPSVLPFRPTVSFLTTGTPVPSICTRLRAFRIQDRNWLSDDDRQIQLHGSLDLLLLTRGDILSDGFRGPLHGLGGHLQIRE